MVYVADNADDLLRRPDFLFDPFADRVSVTEELVGEDFVDHDNELRSIVILIGEQTNVKFAYSPELIEGQKKVTLHLKEAKLAEVLNSLLGSEINYKVVGKRIVLRPVAPISESEELPTIAVSVAEISGQARHRVRGRLLHGNLQGESKWPTALW